MVERHHRRGPDDTTPPPPLARTNLGAASRGGGPHDLRPRQQTLRRRATGQSTPNWQSARQLGPRHPREAQQLPHHCCHPTTRLPFAFGWLVGDTEWAMGIVRGAHGGEWGDFFHRSGAVNPGATERLMAAYLTWRGIPLPLNLQPMARRAQQPHVPSPRPGTNGNAAVARMMPEVPDTTAPPSPPGEPRPSPAPRPDSAPQQRLGPRMYAPWHHRASAHRKAQQPPHPPAHPTPPPTHPPPHHTNSTLRHHRGPVCHRAPDMSVRPNGRHNDTRHNTR